MPLSDTSVALTVKGLLTGTLDLQTLQSQINFGKSLAFTSGTGSGQVDKLFADTRTINASSNDDLDLAGVLIDAFGVAITFVKVKAIVVVADSTNVNNVVIGNAAGTQFVGPFGAAAHTIAVPPGGMFVIARSDATGWAVGAGATDLLRIANSGAGTSVIYQIVILGTSA